MNHTPGPWAWLRNSCTLIGDREGHVLSIDLPEFIHEADKRLIGAAPELLDALKAVTDQMDSAGGDRDGMPECPWCNTQDVVRHAGDCALLIARMAIAKAEGR